MPLARTAQQRREADTVRSAPGRPGYFVPTVEDLDKVLAKLGRDIAAPTLTEAGRDRIREDLDACLDRRLWLTS